MERKLCTLQRRLDFPLPLRAPDLPDFALGCRLSGMQPVHAEADRQVASEPAAPRQAMNHRYPTVHGGGRPWSFNDRHFLDADSLRV
jgi:hypothetical protein